jgi:outer membrane protein insertion porin family
MPFSDLTYYKANAGLIQYFPLASDLTLMLKGDIAYGGAYGSTQDGLPFFEHFFAGGPTSVRGFMANTLGPRDTPVPLARAAGYYPRAFGGSSKLVGTAELLFPVPFLEDSKNIRLGAFFDAGNVFQNGYDLGQLRYSTGLSARWLSPFGALTFSVAQPLNAQTDCYGKDLTTYIQCSLRGTPVADQVQRFQFSFGQGF